MTRLQRETASVTLGQIQGLMLRAVLVLAEAMQTIERNTRLRAARYSLNPGMQKFEIKKANNQVFDLEEALPLRTAHRSAN